MSEFQFVKTQRVTVPSDRAGAEGVQGVVTVNVARLGREPHYEVQWPSCDTVGEMGDLKMLCTDVSESELIEAQPSQMITVEEAAKVARAANERERAEFRTTVDRMGADIARLEAAARRRRKAGRKSASRKRR